MGIQHFPVCQLLEMGRGWSGVFSGCQCISGKGAGFGAPQLSGKLPHTPHPGSRLLARPCDTLSTRRRLDVNQREPRQEATTGLWAPFPESVPTCTAGQGVRDMAPCQGALQRAGAQSHWTGTTPEGPGSALPQTGLFSSVYSRREEKSPLRQARSSPCPVNMFSKSPFRPRGGGGAGLAPKQKERLSASWRLAGPPTALRVSHSC